MTEYNKGRFEKRGHEKTLEWQQRGFDAWIRDRIGGDFRWKIRPLDTPSNRKMAADLILSDIERGGGVFPGSNASIG